MGPFAGGRDASLGERGLDLARSDGGAVTGTPRFELSRGEAPDRGAQAMSSAHQGRGAGEQGDLSSIILEGVLNDTAVGIRW